VGRARNQAIHLVSANQLRIWDELTFPFKFQVPLKIETVLAFEYSFTLYISFAILVDSKGIPRMESALDGIADWVKQDNRSLTSHHPLSVSIVYQATK